ncbi:MAG: 5'-3' exonuclease H3TH domain-containing protein [Candidatus Paceibacterota bacterium]|jgi:DNA polymerase-1
MSEEKKYFVIIDGNSVVHRAFHALPPLKRSDGQIVNAVYGFLLVLFKILKDFEPKYLVACFDRPEPTFRKKKFENYKAKRVKAPQELYDQIPLVKDVLAAFNVPIFEMAGFEGDDIIGTLSRLSVKEDKEIKNIIVSGDNDVFQLVNNDTLIYFLRKGVKDTTLCNEKEVAEKYGGLTPRQIIDYKALRGDASDNIPGVLGIGEKTAIDLILRFGSVDRIFKEVERNNPEIKDSVKEKLIKGKDNAFLSLKLSEIIVDVPLEIKKIEACEWKNYDKEKVVESLLSFGFRSLISKVPYEQEMDGIIAKLKEKEPERKKEATLKLL